MGSNLTAIYDACVLYPAPLRDLLMQLALSDLYRARWTEKIHEEWISNVLKNRPDLKKEQRLILNYVYSTILAKVHTKNKSSKAIAAR